ncbi:MAG: hypothetical protein FWC32_01915 [Firmicutes bacterium]|nr:hypothetical protein [Bacillota bacterium]
MELNELPAVLMWREEKEYVKALTEFSEKYAFDPDLYYRESDSYLFGKIKTKATTGPCTY